MNICYNLEPIVYYIDNIYGYDNLISDITRNNMFMISDESNDEDKFLEDFKMIKNMYFSGLSLPYVYDASGSLLEDENYSRYDKKWPSLEYKCSELVDAFGVYGFTLYYESSNSSNMIFKVDLYVDYGYINYILKHQDYLRNKTYPYNITIDKIYVIDGYDLSNNHILYYINDDIVVYRMDFNRKEFRVVTNENIRKLRNLSQQSTLQLSVYDYLLLLNNNARFYGNIDLLLSRRVSLNFFESLRRNRSLGEKSLNIKKK